MEKELVIFKNSPERLLVILDEEADFRTVLENLCGKIKKNKNFFKGASLRLKYKGRELSEKEEKLIVQAFEQIGEMDVIDIGKEIEVSHSDEGNSFRGMAYGLFDPEDGERPAKRSRGICTIYTKKE